MPNNNKFFFAVYSEDVFGIFTSVELLEKQTSYIEGRHIQTFKSIDCAAICAITGFNTFQYANCQPYEYAGTPTPLEINRLYTYEDIL